MSVNRDSKETGRKTRFSTIFNVGVSFFMRLFFDGRSKGR